MNFNQTVTLFVVASLITGLGYVFTRHRAAFQRINSVATLVSMMLLLGMVAINTAYGSGVTAQWSADSTAANAAFIRDNTARLKAITEAVPAGSMPLEVQWKLLNTTKSVPVSFPRIEPSPIPTWLEICTALLYGASLILLVADAVLPVSVKAGNSNASDV